MRTITIIDDDKDLLQLLKSLLPKSGFATSVYSEWEKASTSIKIYKPHLILLDVFMGAIDGLDICRKIKSNFATRHIPVLVFSSFPKIRESAIYEYCANDFLPKPFKMNDLIRKFNELIGRNNGQ